MLLSDAYFEVAKRLDGIDFGSLWEGFERFSFAIYDDNDVILDGVRRNKTDEFLANTAIMFEGRHIAIWKLDGEPNLDELASKIVHEMFHAYQMKNGEKRFPNEFEAVLKYEYSPAYLQLKYDENHMLASLCRDFCNEGLSELLSCRRARQQQYPYNYAYESAIEAIEGSAQYIEAMTLKQLNLEKHETLMRSMISRIENVNKLIPARIQCYDVGALLIKLCRDNNLSIDYRIGETDAVFYQGLVDRADVRVLVAPISKEIMDLCMADEHSLRRRIEGIVESGECTRGAFKLLGFNVYSARYMDGFLLSEYFIMYEANTTITEYGDFVAKLSGDIITELYKKTDA